MHSPGDQDGLSEINVGPLPNIKLKKDQINVANSMANTSIHADISLASLVASSELEQG